MKTNAFSIIVKSVPPETSAFLANLIVDEFFLQEKTKNKYIYEKNKAFFEKSLLSAQMKYEQKKAELDQFLINNPTAIEKFDILLIEIASLRKRNLNIENKLILLDQAFKNSDYRTLSKKEFESPLISNNFIQTFNSYESDQNSSVLFDKLNMSTKMEIGRLKVLLKNNKNILQEKERRADKQLAFSKRLIELEAQCRLRKGSLRV